MIFNVVNGGGQTYDNGDAIKYPVSNIPQGAEKVYTEQYISDVGQGIRSALANNLQYTTQEMIVALSTILTYVHDCSNAINEKTGGIGEISLPNMAAAIAEIPQGGSGIGTEWIITTSTYTVIT